jgi:tetratricopeptide (TPR) repeat protein
MLLTSALLLPLLMPAALPQSRVQKVDGGSIIGELNVAGFETVDMTVGGSARSLKANEILSLTPGPFSESLSQGETFFTAHDYQNAASTFEAAAAEEGGAFWVKPWAELRHAETLLAWSQADRGRAGDAAKAFRNWTSGNADSYWLPRAQMGQAKAMAMSGDVDGATTLMQKLSDTAFEKNLGRHVELNVNLVRCEAFLIGGQAEVAQARLRDLVVKLAEAVQSPDTPDGSKSLFSALHSHSQVLLGDAITEKDGGRAAATYWEGLAQDRNVSADVRAAAWIGIATNAREQGQAREAQLQLAKVVATLPANDELMARALYELGEVSKELGNNPSSGDAYHQRLLKRYPNTSWAAKVR